jgi:hypothetical protein
MMRQALLALPDGEASYSDVVDGDGVLEAGETEDATFQVRIRSASGATASRGLRRAPTGQVRGR